MRITITRGSRVLFGAEEEYIEKSVDSGSADRYFSLVVRVALPREFCGCVCVCANRDSGTRLRKKKSQKYSGFMECKR